MNAGWHLPLESSQHGIPSGAIDLSRLGDVLIEKTERGVVDRAGHDPLVMNVGALFDVEEASRSRGDEATHPTRSPGASTLENVPRKMTSGSSDFKGRGGPRHTRGPRTGRLRR